MLRSFAAVLFVTAALVAQSPDPKAPSVRVPVFPNSTCPIMGKKISLPLFVDTVMGRIYICCKPCIRKTQRDVPTAHKTAFPVVEEVANEVCPVSGAKLGATAVAVTLQGSRFKVCCADCVPVAQAHHQVTLVRLHEPKLVDVGNRTCPIDGKPVAANAFAVVGEAIVHLSAPAQVAEVEKAPAKVLAKALEIAAKQPKAEPHRCKPAEEPAKEPAKDPAAGGKGEVGAESGR